MAVDAMHRASIAEPAVPVQPVRMTRAISEEKRHKHAVRDLTDQLLVQLNLRIMSVISVTRSLALVAH